MFRVSAKKACNVATSAAAVSPPLLLLLLACVGALFTAVDEFCDVVSGESIVHEADLISLYVYEIS